MKPEKYIGWIINSLKNDVGKRFNLAQVLQLLLNQLFMFNLSFSKLYQAIHTGMGEISRYWGFFPKK